VEQAFLNQVVFVDEPPEVRASGPEVFRDTLGEAELPVFEAGRRRPGGV
jgi:hypothetical protein